MRWPESSIEIPLNNPGEPFKKVSIRGKEEPLITLCVLEQKVLFHEGPLFERSEGKIRLPPTFQPPKG